MRRAFRLCVDGQALVEFGLVLPVLLLTLLGMLSVGRGFVFGVAVQQGAREAARIGSAAALDTSVTDPVVLDRLIAASAPALTGCASALDTAQSCSGGTWTLSINVKSPSGTTYTSLAAARASAPGGISGWRLEVKARGSVPLLLGFDTGFLGGKLGLVDVQGDAVMVVF